MYKLLKKWQWAQELFSTFFRHRISAAPPSVVVGEFPDTTARVLPDKSHLDRVCVECILRVYMKTHRKGSPRSPERVSIRVNISLPQSLRQVADAVVVQKGFVGLSDYVQAHLRQDASSIGLSRFSL